MGFVSLHTHSDHSLRDGFQSVKDILRFCSGVGQTAVALTDHGTMSGCGEGFRYASQFGIKFIAGCEHYLVSDVTIKDKENQHIILLAKNAEGYRNLNIITTLAHQNFYVKPRIDLDILRKHHNGIICTTACLGGCQNKARQLLDIFGQDLFIEIHTNSLSRQPQANVEWLKICDKYGIPFYAAVDAHHTLQRQAEMQRIWAGYDGKYEECDDYYMHTEEQVREALKYLPQDIVELAIANTQMVADQCIFELQFGGNYYPKSEYEDPKQEVRRRVWQGCKEKGIDKDKEHIAQIKHEMEVLEQVGYFDYFLIVSDMINWCKEHNIRVGAGRGSVVGCDVAYCMGITAVDPLAHNLVFERFAHTERVSPPDKK